MDKLQVDNIHKSSQSPIDYANIEINDFFKNRYPGLKLYFDRISVMNHKNKVELTFSCGSIKATNYNKDSFTITKEAIELCANDIELMYREFLEKAQNRLNKELE